MKLFSVAALLLLSFSNGADVVSEYHDLALQFAPRFRFDQTQGDSLGKCLPGNAEDYYRLRKNGFTGRICNMDYISIMDGRVPAYYEAKQCGEDYFFSYWLFYGYQDDCPLGSDGGDVSWTRYVVKVKNGTNVDRVIFYQHAGWYTRNPGRYEVMDSTHPIAYVGKLRHGAYHDDGGSGTCCYFEDFRNPGSTDKHIDTWTNLVWLRADETAPEWMVDNDSYWWNGVTLPHLRGQDLCDLRGCKGIYLQVCETCGCIKSDVDDDERP